MNLKLYIPIALMCLPPWGALLGPLVANLGLTAQFIGVVVQIVGLVFLFSFRKRIFGF